MATVGTIGTATQGSAETAQTALDAALLSLPGDPSPVDMLKIQRQLTIMTVMIDLSASLTKSIGDSLKSVIQKAG